MKKFFAGFFTCYLFAGYAIGGALAHFVPATNFIGVTYIAAIWPYWVIAPVFGFDPPVPPASFTFN